MTTTATATAYSRGSGSGVQHGGQQRPNGGAPTAPRQLLSSPYNPPPHLLHSGARNRLILSVRSGVPSEVDHALPRLVLASFDQPELFKLEGWVDSIPALLDWPTRWLVELEKEAALYQLRRGQLDGNPLKRKKSDAVLGVIAEWTRDPDLVNRATNSLLILRNASFANNNASVMTRPSLVDFIERFFLLPLPFLLELSLRISEPIQHLLVILQSIFPILKSQLTPALLDIFGTVLPTLLVESRDSAIINLLLPLLISSFALAPTHPFPPLPPTLIPYLLKLLTLSPAPPLLDLSIDLLITLTTSSPANTRLILSLPSFPAHLRNLMLLLEHGAKPLQATWEAPGPYQGVLIRNPASMNAQAEAAAQQRKRDRDLAARQLETHGRVELVAEVGDRPPVISQAMRKKLYSMAEPQRSIAW
jgi:chromatin structure-remodeling complex subunit RSC9